MLDVEFLLSPPSKLTVPVVYLYQEGLLRAPILNALKAAWGSGRDIFESSPNGFSFGAGLFDGIPFCDVGQIFGPEAHGSQSSAVSEFIDTAGDAVLFASVSMKQLGAQLPDKGASLRRRLGERSLIIEERSVTDQSLPVFLQYLESTSDLIINARLQEQSAFRSYFESYIAAQKQVGYSEILNEFERAILLFVDEDTGQFTHRIAEADIKERSLIAHPFRQLVLQRDIQVIHRVLLGFERRFPSATFRNILIELIQETRRLVQFMKVKSTDTNDPALINLSIWTAVLLNACQVENREIVHNNGVVLVDRLARDLFARSDNSNLARPLEGLWSFLVEPPSDFGEIFELRGELAEVLASRTKLPFHWLRRLQSILQSPSPVNALNNRDDQPNRKAKKFSEILEQDRAVFKLKQRCCDHKHSAPIMLCGVDGVGKRALARTYGKTAVCQNVGPDNVEFCDSCDDCRLFDDGLSVFEIDASSPVVMDYFRELLAHKITLTPLGGRHIVIVDRADENAALMDLCLKTLERRLKSVTFLFLVQDLDRVNAACRSRCEVLQLLPLSSLSIDNLMSAINEADLDNLVRGLLTSLSDGLPGKLAQNYTQVLSSGARRFADVMQVLSLDWGQETVACWRTILHQPGTCPTGLDDVSNAVIAGRIRSVLRALHQIHIGIEPEAIFAFGAKDEIVELDEVFNAAAKRLGKTSSTLWNDLAAIWNSADIVDELGLKQAIFKTQASLISFG